MSTRPSGSPKFERSENGFEDLLFLPLPQIATGAFPLVDLVRAVAHPVERHDGS
jgi:hypothetical protein